MSDDAKPVEPTPADAPAADTATDKPAETTPAPVASETPAATESKPVEETPAKTEETPAEPPKKEKVAPKPVEPITSGIVSYKGPEKFPKNLLGPQKVHFWFGDDAVPTKKLGNFLQHAKAEGHSIAAWSEQTGKGLLYWAKHEKDKEYPTGVIPLSDVSDVSTVGTSEFTFKTHGQKHAFLTTSERVRDGWLKSLKAEVEAAVGKKEEVTGSEGYKKTLDGLKPAVVGSSVGGAASAISPAAKKSEERGTRETNSTTKSQSRSLSRGKRGSILDRLAGKKDEVKDKAEEVVGKKDEPAKEEADAAPAAPPKDDAPAETAAVEEPKKEEVKAEEPKKVEEPKQTRRSSRIGDFFKRPEVKTPATEKKAPEVAPAVPPKDNEVPKPADKKDEEAATAAVAAAPLPVVAGEELKKEEKKDEPKKEAATTPKTAEKKNFFDRFRPKDLPAKPAATAAPKEAEPAKPAAEAPATTEAATEAEPAKSSTEAPALNGEAKDTAVRPSTDKQEKRRSSFFTGDIAGSLKKIGQKIEKPVEPKKEEKPQTNGDHVKDAEPAKDKPVETPAAAPTSKKEKEHKESPISKLGRRFSTAIRNAGGVGKENKKEAPAPNKVEDSKEPAEAKAEEPTKAEDTKPAEEAKPAEGEKAVNSIGDVVPEAVNVGSAPQANATVSATA